MFFPVIIKNYWYFTEYFCLYIFIPLINKGILYLDKVELKIIIINLFSIFIVLKEIINPEYNSLHLNSGYSSLWLLILYIIGAYFEKYRKKQKKNFFLFLYI